MNTLLTKVLATSIAAVAPTTLAGRGKGSTSLSQGSGELATVPKTADSYSASHDNT